VDQQLRNETRTSTSSPNQSPSRPPRQPSRAQIYSSPTSHHQNPIYPVSLPLPLGALFMLHDKKKRKEKRPFLHYIKIIMK
jgi:hypothetical protein